MGGFIQSVRSDLLGYYFGKGSITLPTLYVGLSSTTPSSIGGNVTEPSGSGYGRIATAAIDWDIPVDGDPSEISNAAAFTFSPASADWVAGANITHGVIFDDPVAGTAVGFGALVTPKPILSGDTAKIDVGAFVFTLAGA